MYQQRRLAFIHTLSMRAHRHISLTRLLHVLVFDTVQTLQCKHATVNQASMTSNISASRNMLHRFVFMLKFTRLTLPLMVHTRRTVAYIGSYKHIPRHRMTIQNIPQGPPPAHGRARHCVPLRALRHAVGTVPRARLHAGRRPHFLPP
jgi:hypothetical protein